MSAGGQQLGANLVSQQAQHHLADDSAVRRVRWRRVALLCLGVAAGAL